MCKLEAFICLSAWTNWCFLRWTYISSVESLLQFTRSIQGRIAALICRWLVLRECRLRYNMIDLIIFIARVRHVILVPSRRFSLVLHLVCDFLHRKLFWAVLRVALNFRSWIWTRIFIVRVRSALLWRGTIRYRWLIGVWFQMRDVLGRPLWWAGLFLLAT